MSRLPKRRIVDPSVRGRLSVSDLPPLPPPSRAKKQYGKTPRRPLSQRSGPQPRTTENLSEPALPPPSTGKRMVRAMKQRPAAMATAGPFVLKLDETCMEPVGCGAQRADGSGGSSDCREESGSGDSNGDGAVPMVGGLVPGSQWKARPLEDELGMMLAAAKGIRKLREASRRISRSKQKRAAFM